MTLETMEPNPAWSPDAHEESLAPFEDRADKLTVRVWGGDWCGDCRAVLPDFAAALEAAGIPDDRIEEYEVEKLDDGSKAGPRMDEYDVEYIPTIVLEYDGEEVARFVEDEPVPPVTHLADRLRERAPSA